MKAKISAIAAWIRAWLAGHRRLLKGLGIAALSTLGLLIISVGALFIYCRNAYPNEIILEDAYWDLSALDLSFSNRDLKTDYKEDQAVTVTPSDTGSLPGGLAEENRVTISQAGTYILQGDWQQRTLTVDAGETAKVHLILDNLQIRSASGAAIYIRSGDKVVLTTTAGSENSLSDGTQTTADGDTNIDAAIFSKADLTLNGQGKLTVQGNTAHGIVSKDDLVITSGEYQITGIKKGLNGKDCVKIHNGSIRITSGTDGISSDNTEDTNTGFVYIEDGTIQIETNRDGIQASNALILEKPSISITTGGGAACAPEKPASHGKGRREQDQKEETENQPSAKGLKSQGDLLINGGNYQLDTLDDSIHADHSIHIRGGSFTIQSGDDGIHAEHTLQITDGKTEIQKSFEGLEGYQILLSGGEHTVYAEDDGLNAASGSSVMGFLQGFFAPSALGKLEIRGGNITVTSGGDTLDSNGVFSITGGVVLAAGPSSQGDGLVDCDTGATVDGGTLICIRTADDDAEPLFETEDQLQITKTIQPQKSGTVLELQSPEGTDPITFTATQAFDTITITAPWLQEQTNLLINGQPW